MYSVKLRSIFLKIESWNIIFHQVELFICVVVHFRKANHFRESGVFSDTHVILWIALQLYRQEKPLDLDEVILRWVSNLDAEIGTWCIYTILYFIYK